MKKERANLDEIWQDVEQSIEASKKFCESGCCQSEDMAIKLFIGMLRSTVEHVERDLDYGDS